MRIIVQTALCAGHGRCYDIAPAIFEPDAEGHVRLRDASGEVRLEHEGAAQAAVRNCPERALSLDL